MVASEELGAISHSDGDVIFHALVDAMLGALGQGDIGQLFPNTDPRWKDAPSRLFVEEAMRRVRQAGYRVSNADITLLLEKPKIGPLRQQMLDSLRPLLGGAAIVNLKAGTNEGCDAIGRGEAVAAHAVVLLAAAT
jgi:2-C-methyl-D-erythritol 2,4-cyclodiphosphate synthase